MMKLTLNCWLVLAVYMHLAFTGGDELCYTSDLRAIEIHVREFTTEIRDSVTKLKNEIDALKKQNKEHENPTGHATKGVHDIIRHLQNETNTLTGQETHMQNRILTNKNGVKYLQPQLSDYWNETVASGEQNKEQQSIITDLQDAITHIKKQIAALKREIFGS